MIGIDEVGRGCWAGPLLVVAFRPNGTLPDGLRDSKKLSKRRRQQYIPTLNAAGDTGYGWVWPDEIDTHGLSAAMKLGVARALQAIKSTHDEHIVMDGTVNYCSHEFARVEVRARADDTEPAVSAASVLAKVARDEYMLSQSSLYPEYGFEQHVGYGTTKHQAALLAHGVTLIHRRSYSPIRRILEASA